MIVILDINGVLADVFTRGDRRPEGRMPDTVLPSGQPVYLRPGLEEFFDLLDKHRWHVVLWTSRRAANAKPIEDLLRHRFGFDPEIKLHGEDCRGRIEHHPVKDIAAIRNRLGEWARSTRIVVVDDNPQFVRSDANTTTLLVPSYNAQSDRADDALEAVGSRLCSYAKVFDLLLTGRHVDESRDGNAADGNGTADDGCIAGCVVGSGRGVFFGAGLPVDHGDVGPCHAVVPVTPAPRAAPPTRVVCPPAPPAVPTVSPDHYSAFKKMIL
jgi:hypothetical protein